MQLQQRKTWLTDLLYLLFGLLGFYLLFLGAHHLLTPDEARYTEVSREMLANHSFWIPWLNGVPFFDKPTLFYWLQISAMSIFGVNEWAARLWTAVLGVSGCLLVYAVGRVLYDRLTGIISAVILATSLVYFLMSHYANIDLTIAVLISAAIGFFLMANQYPLGKLRSRLILFSYVMAGFAVLTKGLIGILFPTMIIGTWIMLTKQWFLLKRMHLLWGALIVILINLPWLIVAQIKHHEFWYYYFYIQQIGRFISTDFNDKQPFWFYLPVILLGMLPWSFFLLQALAQKIRSICQHYVAHFNDLYLLLWPLLIMVFFSIPRSKTLGYILPVFPPLAIIVGYYIRQIWNCDNKQRVVCRCLSVLGILAAIALVIFKADVSGNFNTYMYIISMVFVLASFALWLCQGLAFRYSFTVLVMACFMTMVTLLSGVKTLQLTAIPRLLPIIKLYEIPQATVVEYYRFDRDLPFYLQHPVTIVANWNNPKLKKKDSWQGIFAYEYQYKQYPNLWTPKEFWKAWNAERPLIVLVKGKKLADFQEKAKNSAIVVANYHGKVVVINESILHLQQTTKY